jgi:hypothetical protein
MVQQEKQKFIQPQAGKKWQAVFHLEIQQEDQQAQQ